MAHANGLSWPRRARREASRQRARTHEQGDDHDGDPGMSDMRIAATPDRSLACVAP